MSLITPFGGRSAQDEILAAANEHLERLIRTVRLLTNQLEAGEFKDLAETTKVVRDAGAALQIAFRERENVEKLRRKDAGIVHDYAIDFDAARDEIGRRLDCLRAARNADGLP
ncbi:hypothetical protein PSA7680_00808 [Pseudoruegeria aquimaris]|uniref:Uncharacterized protein n=1 Tax=Pseudoruegeria aquimaris TaxID=393663 RepID=A0A1Y5RSG7_9RHOB|nr:hypothetical protein [Pseudoruegeria aquimaris]SLN21630.1 hypothetical protein PSA7680_00808 [Pseudoruegeria aquimaris]